MSALATEAQVCVSVNGLYTNSFAQYLSNTGGDRTCVARGPVLVPQLPLAISHGYYRLRRGSVVPHFKSTQLREYASDCNGTKPIAISNEIIIAHQSPFFEFVFSYF